MQRFLARRLLQTIVVLFGVCTAVFGLMRLSGDPVALLVSFDSPPEQIERVRHRLGLDQPLYVQYLLFMRDVATGNFGDSLHYKVPAMGMVVERLPNTVALALLSLAFALILAVPLGVVGAVKHGTVVDNVVSVISLLGQAMPNFWLGLMLMLVFSVRLRLLPTSGSGSLATLVLPTVTLATYSMARIARLVRSSMLEILAEPFIWTARAKGLTEPMVIYRHALRHAGISIVTMAAHVFAALMGGAIIVETVFGYSGMGRLLVQAVFLRDYPVVQAASLMIALFVVGTYVVADIVYAIVDPRIRIG